MRRTALIALFVASFGCERSPTTIGVLGDDTAAVIFIVTLDEANGVVRVTDPLRVPANESNAARLSITLDETERKTLLIELSQSTLAQHFLGYDPSRLDELTVEVEVPPPIPLLEANIQTFESRRAAALPSGVTISSLELGNAERSVPLATDDARFVAVHAALTVRVPVDPEYCRSESVAPLTAYGGTTKLSDDGLLEVVGVGSDRLVVATLQSIHLLDRGGALRSSIGIASLTPSEPRNAFQGIAAKQLPGEERYRVVAVANYRPPGPELGTSWAFEFFVDSSSISYARTIQFVENVRFRDVAMNDDTLTAIVGDEGDVRLERRNGSFEELMVPPESPQAEGDVARRIRTTDDPRRPWFFSSRGRIHFYDVPTKDFVTDEVGLADGKSLHLPALAIPSNTRETYWAAGSVGRLFRFDANAETWERQFPQLPPRYIDCAPDGDASRPGLVDAFVGMAQLDGYLYVAVDFCNAILSIDAETGCAATIAPEGLEQPQRLTTGLGRMTIIDGELIVTSGDGSLYRTRVAAPF